MPQKSNRDTATAAKPTLQGVSRALRVLEVLARNPMRASETAEALGMSWATLYRVLTQLEADGYLEKDASGVYRIGRRSWLLGSTYLVGHRLFELAMPVVKQTALSVPHAVFQIVERIEANAVVLYSQESANGETITRTTYGYHFPLHTGSKGLMLLAHAPESFIDEYLRGELISLTPNTITDPQQIRQRLAEIREAGYCVTIADVQSFTGSVAAPVYDASGTVCAAICAVVPRSSLDDAAQQNQLVDAVMRSAQAVSLGMGWQPMLGRR